MHNTCVGFSNDFLSVGSWVLNLLQTKVVYGVSYRQAIALHLTCL